MPSTAPDPQALSAIEGVQLPGWGGYDYARIAHAVDVMEIYPGDETLASICSINLAVIPLITGFATSPNDIHDIWRAVLLGSRGLILWDEGSPGRRRRRRRARPAPAGTLAPAVRRADAARSGGACWPPCRPAGPLAILYSPASLRTQLAARPPGRGRAVGAPRFRGRGYRHHAARGLHAASGVAGSPIAYTSTLCWIEAGFVDSCSQRGISAGARHRWGGGRGGRCSDGRVSGNCGLHGSGGWRGRVSNVRGCESRRHAGRSGSSRSASSGIRRAVRCARRGLQQNNPRLEIATVVKRPSVHI